MSNNKTLICGIELDVRQDTSEKIPHMVEYEFPELTVRVINALLRNKNIIFTGDTGEGKTSLVQQIAARINMPLERMSCCPETSKSDFIGQFIIAQDKTIIWIDGPLTKAVREGHWIILDEIDSALAAVLTFLNALTDSDNPALLLDSKGGEVIPRHKDFRIIGTSNTIGPMSSERARFTGTQVLNAAFLDRFHIFHIEALPKKQKHSILVKRTGIPGPIAEKMIITADAINKAFKEGEIHRGIPMRSLIQWAEEFMIYPDPIISATEVILNKFNAEEATPVKEIIQRHMDITKRT